MHVENNLVEIMTVEDREYEEIVEEYEEEILVPEGVPEPSVTDTVSDTAPTQGKPRCITCIFYDHDIYICYAFTLQRFYDIHMHIYIYL
jgi:hypothetical protein